MKRLPCTQSFCRAEHAFRKTTEGITRDFSQLKWNLGNAGIWGWKIPVVFYFSDLWLIGFCLSMERKRYVKGFAYCLFSIYVAYCCHRSQKGRKSLGEVTSDLGRLVSGWSQTGGHRFSEGRVCTGLGKREIVEFGKAHWKIRLKLWETGGLWEAEMEKHCVLLCYLYSTLSCLAFIVDIIVSSVNEQTVFLAGQESISRSVCLNSPKKSPPCPALCLLLPPTAQRLQAASVIAMCICNMKHPPPHPCKENK